MKKRTLVGSMLGLPMFVFAAPSTPDLSWLQGNWVQRMADGSVEERWVGPVGQTLVAVNLTSHGGRARFEYLRIAPGNDGILTYFAQPGGNAPAVEFKLAEAGRERLTFENPAHDFPRRIIYWRDGDRLRARIEGSIEGREAAQEWAFEPTTTVSCGPR